MIFSSLVHVFLSILILTGLNNFENSCYSFCSIVILIILIVYQFSMTIFCQCRWWYLFIITTLLFLHINTRTTINLTLLCLHSIHTTVLYRVTLLIYLLLTPPHPRRHCCRYLLILTI